MSLTYLVFATADDAETRQTAIAAAMGYPDPEAKTLRYADIINHPTDGRALLPIAECYSQAAEAVVDAKTLLTAGEIASLKNVAWATAQGWFPSDPMPGQ